MDQVYKTLLKKQGYHFIGEHSACKTCEYTAKSMVDKGKCYKQTFYGIQSHLCMQTTVAANFCNMDCVFCWRDRNNSSFGKIDDPIALVDGAIEAQQKLLSGFGGHKDVNFNKWVESQQPKHCAISLNGENTAYPRLGEFIAELHRRGISSFLVTNGLLPEVLAKITPPTQLYISFSAPNPELFEIVDKPLYKDGWDRLMRSFDLMRKFRDEKVTRTVIRLTVIKGITDSNENAREFGEIVKRAHPRFIEVKSYMWLGASRNRLSGENSNTHEEVRAFAEKVGEVSGYKIISEQPESKVVLMMEEDGEDRVIKPGQHLPFA